MTVRAASRCPAHVVDCDSHVYEPPEIWDEYVESAYRPLARAALWHTFDETGDRVTILNGAKAPHLNRSRILRLAIWRPGMRPEDVGDLDPDAFHEPNPGAWDPEARLADLDAMAIDQQVVFPTLFAEHLPLVENPDVADVLARAYNDWARDFARAAPERLFPVAVLPLQSLLLARREIARVAELGFRAVLVRPMFYDVQVLPDTGTTLRKGGVFSFAHEGPRGVFLNHPHFRPLWRQIEELGLVACIHPSLGITNPESVSSGSFVERVAERMGIGHTVAEPVAYTIDNALFLTMACYHGLMEDFPGLRLALLHSGAAWLPLVLEKAETYLWLSIPGVFTAPDEPPSLEPSSVFRDHPAIVSFDGWEASVARMPDLFGAKAAWGSRYPQHDAGEPSEALALMHRHGVDASTVARMMGGNAADLFRLPVPAPA